jgi:uncharacterized protein (DUF1684 family)
MKYSLIVLLSFLILGCGNDANDTSNKFEKELLTFRKSRNKKMTGANSPLPAEERKNFIGLNFYPPNQSLMIKAKFDLIFTQNVIEMKTNTDRVPQFIPFGTITFNYLEKKHVLTAYKSLDSPSNELFIPFTDLSNGNETYTTGRYIDVDIPLNDSIILDFNRCYNPYCAYSTKFSCPIPPIENHLDVKIKAGEKKSH